MIFYDECNTIIGYLHFIFKENGLLEQVVLNDDHWRALVTKHKVKRNHGVGNPICQQFQEYIHGDRKQIDVPFELTGTPFQRQTWTALRSIPFGETRSYSEIATVVGKPKATLAIGRACAVNPLPILIPCHRVIGKNRALTGYAGGTDRKRQLLLIEGVKIY